MNAIPIIIGLCVWLLPAVATGVMAWWGQRGESGAVIPWPLAFVVALFWPIGACWWAVHFVRTQLRGFTTERMARTLAIAEEAAKTHGVPRSPQWETVRKKHLELWPFCRVCGEHGANEVHHIQCFHLHPELELVETNLITLCRPHHLLVGHLMNWTSINEHCVVDCANWREKISKRPL